MRRRVKWITHRENVSHDPRCLGNALVTTYSIVGEDPPYLIETSQRWKFFNLKEGRFGRYVDSTGNEATWEDKSLNPGPYRFLFVDDAMDVAELHLRRHYWQKFRSAIRTGRRTAQLYRARQEGHPQITRLRELRSIAKSSGTKEEYRALERQISEFLSAEFPMSMAEVEQFLQLMAK